MQQSSKGAPTPKSPYVFPEVGFFGFDDWSFLLLFTIQHQRESVGFHVTDQRRVFPPFSGISERYGSLCRSSAPGLTVRFDPLIDLA